MATLRPFPERLTAITPIGVWQRILGMATLTRYDLEDTMISVFDAYDSLDIPLAEPFDCDGPKASVLYAQTRVYPTKLALTRVSKRFRELSTPYLYECLICDRPTWWTKLVLTLRDTGWGKYTRRVEFHLGDRDVGADVFLVLACLLACPNVRVVNGFNLARLLTVFPPSFTYHISHLHTSFAEALAVFNQHPQIASSLRTMELYGEDKKPLPLVDSTRVPLHFPQLVSLTVELEENQNEDLQLFQWWTMPFLQAFLVKFRKMQPSDFESPLFYGCFDVFGHTLTLLSIQCDHRYSELPSFMLNNILDLCPGLVGLVLDMTLTPWNLRPGRVAHPQISLIALAHFTVAGACLPTTTGRVYESVLKLMNRFYFPNLIHVRVLAPEAVMTFMNVEQMKEMSKGILWLKAWRDHLLRFGTRFENCLGADFFNSRGSSVLPPEKSDIRCSSVCNLFKQGYSRYVVHRLPVDCTGGKRFDRDTTWTTPSPTIVTGSFQVITISALNSYKISEISSETPKRNPLRKTPTSPGDCGLTSPHPKGHSEVSGTTSRPLGTPITSRYFSSSPSLPRSTPRLQPTVEPLLQGLNHDEALAGNYIISNDMFATKQEVADVSRSFTAATVTEVPNTHRRKRRRIENNSPRPQFQLVTVKTNMDRGIPMNLRLLLVRPFLVQGKAALPILAQIRERWPTMEALSTASFQSLKALLQPLGLSTKRAHRLITFAQTWLSDPPTQDHLRPSRVSVTRGESKYPPTAVSHLPGMGRYALDSYRIFCAKTVGDTEWRNVMPLDKELRVYLRWKWAL
ncbi:hypothetical protein FRC18_000472, partial [Serendipita sp. 400]